MQGSLKEKYFASLLGLAIGDALGFPFEGLRLEDLIEINLCYFQRGKFPPGTWSDDTSLTFLTVESLLVCQGLNLRDLAFRFWRWLKEGYFTPFGEAIGIGKATRKALLRFASGILPEHAGGRGERDCGNGSLMRLLPIVLWYGDASEKTLLARVWEASSLTHAHPRVFLACGLYALLLQRFILGQKLTEALLYVRAQGLSLCKENRLFSREALHFTPLWDGSLFSLPVEALQTSGYVVHTLLAAFGILFHTNSFKEAVKLAVRLGGDTDTTAAIAGAAAGLYYGLAEIPLPWLDGLVKGRKLRELANQFVTEVLEQKNKERI